MKPTAGTTSTVRRPPAGTTPSTATNTAGVGSGARGGVRPRVGLVGAGAGRVKDPAAAGKATTAATTQKAAGAPGAKGKATATLAAGDTGAVAVTSEVAAAAAAEEVKPAEVEVKPEDETEALVESSQAVVVEVSSEEPHDTLAVEEPHEERVEVLVDDVGAQHEEGGSSMPASPPIEGEEMQYAEGNVREDEVISPPPASGSELEPEPEHEHEHEAGRPGEEEYEFLQLSEEQREELFKDDVPGSPEPSEAEIAEAAAHPGAEEHLEKVVPPYQPSVLPTGEQINEDKREVEVEVPDDA
jgi:hypothetical protein